MSLIFFASSCARQTISSQNTNNFIMNIHLLTLFIHSYYAKWISIELILMWNLNICSMLTSSTFLFMCSLSAWTHDCNKSLTITKSLYNQRNTWLVHVTDDYNKKWQRERNYCFFHIIDWDTVVGVLIFFPLKLAYRFGSSDIRWRWNWS